MDPNGIERDIYIYISIRDHSWQEFWLPLNAVDLPVFRSMQYVSGPLFCHHYVVMALIIMRCDNNASLLLLYFLFTFLKLCSFFWIASSQGISPWTYLITDDVMEEQPEKKKRESGSKKEETSELNKERLSGSPILPLLLILIDCAE